jgi:two-component system, NarL family, response regulator DevR
MESTNPIRILIVDDHEVVRLGLNSLFELVNDIEVVGEADTSAGAIAAALKLEPDVVLMDIRLPDGSGVDACKHIRQRRPSTKVLFLTSYADSETVLSAIVSGGDGYVLKEAFSDNLLNAIRNVAAGRSMLGPEVTGDVLSWIREASRKDETASDEALSGQERKILSLVAQGSTNAEIASEIGLSVQKLVSIQDNIHRKLARRSGAKESS